MDNEYKLEAHKLTHDLGQTKKEFKVNIEEIKERHSKATPGPWKWVTPTILKNNQDETVLLFESFPTNVEQTEWDETLMATEEDKEMIEHSSADIQYLLSIIEQAEKALERAKDYLESGLHYGPAEAIEEALQAIRGK